MAGRSFHADCAERSKKQRSFFRAAGLKELLRDGLRGLGLNGPIRVKRMSERWPADTDQSRRFALSPAPTGEFDSDFCCRVHRRLLSVTLSF
jgi:hypothetical protein